MAITIGSAGSTPPFGTDIISATYTEEMELIDVTNRTNVGTGIGTKVNEAGFVTKTWEIECHDPSTAITALTTQATSGSFTVMSVTETASVDGAMTYTITAKEG